MDIAELFHELRFITDIEIVVTLLPKMLGLADQTPRYSLLERLERISKRPPPRLADQQVNVFRHYHVAVDAKSKTAPDALQPELEGLLRRCPRLRRATTVATERHKMTLPGFVESFQTPRHKASLAPSTAPLKPKEGLNGPPDLGLAQTFSRRRRLGWAAARGGGAGHGWEAGRHRGSCTAGRDS
jgi:hypothetical protein